MYVVFKTASIRQEILLSNKTRKQVLNKILEILNDSQLTKALRLIDKKNKNIKSRILYFLMKKRYVHIIYFLYKLR